MVNARGSLGRLDLFYKTGVKINGGWEISENFNKRGMGIL